MIKIVKVVERMLSTEPIWFVWNGK